MTKMKKRLDDLQRAVLKKRATPKGQELPICEFCTKLIYTWQEAGVHHGFGRDMGARYGVKHNFYVHNKPCHVFLNNPVINEKFLRRKFGEDYDKMKFNANKVTKYTNMELIEEYFKSLLEEK